jgi:uncharacterized protein YjiS (DUF1127 family)
MTNLAYRLDGSDCEEPAGAIAYASRFGPAKEFLIRAFDTLGEWADRVRQRRHLMALDDRILRDIGLDRGHIISEAEKPFWRR